MVASSRGHRVKTENTNGLPLYREKKRTLFKGNPCSPYEKKSGNSAFRRGHERKGVAGTHWGLGQGGENRPPSGLAPGEKNILHQSRGTENHAASDPSRLKAKRRTGEKCGNGKRPRGRLLKVPVAHGER